MRVVIADEEACHVVCARLELTARRGTIAWECASRQARDLHSPLLACKVRCCVTLSADTPSRSRERSNGEKEKKNRVSQEKYVQLLQMHIYERNNVTTSTKPLMGGRAKSYTPLWSFSTMNIV